MKKPPKNRREAAQYPALKKGYNLKSRQHLIDFDYLDKLNPEELDWLNRFSEEYHGANFKHKGKIVQRKKAQRKNCTDMNNHRNNDVLVMTNVQGILSNITDTKDNDLIDMNPEQIAIAMQENALIEQQELDFPEKLKKKRSNTSKKR